MVRLQLRAKKGEGVTRVRSILLLLLALPFVGALTGCGAAEESVDANEAAAASPVPAAVMEVAAASGTETISGAGTVRLRRETELGFTTAGQVARVAFDEGDRVGKGAVLAALDTSTVRADLDAAQAERERADAEYDRIASLYKDGWVTKARFEQAEAARRAAAARVEASGFASRTARIVAPSSGIVLARNIDPGQVVAPGTTAMVLGETSKGFVLRVPMTDAEAVRIAPGMRAQVTIAAVSDDPIDAVVSEKGGRADARTGTFEVSFLLPANDRLRSGQLGTVAIEVERGDDGAIVVPPTALFALRSGEGLVYVVDAKNRVRPRNVVVGKLTDDALEISDGLRAGDVVVTRGAERLRTGDTIRPVRATP